MANTKLELFGVAEALKELRAYDKTAYGEILERMRVQGNPIAARVGVAFPEKGLTYWRPRVTTTPRRRTPGTKKQRPFPPYVAGAARMGVKPVVQVRRPVNGVYRLMRLQQMTAGGAILDSAGSKTANIFTKNLDLYSPVRGAGVSTLGRSRSRVLYKAVDDNMPMVEEVVRIAIGITDRLVTESINRRAVGWQ